MSESNANDQVVPNAAGSQAPAEQDVTSDPAASTNSTPKPGQGLAGLNIDVSEMSPESLQAYADYKAVAEDDDTGDGHITALQKAEHALRTAINRDELNRTLNKAEQDPSEKKV